MNSKQVLIELRDTLAYVMAYAPHAFPREDFLPPERQPTLTAVFNEIRREILNLKKTCPDRALVEEFERRIESAFQFYSAGDARNGFLETQESLHLSRRF